jgi:hypothetical protein
VVPVLVLPDPVVPWFLSPDAKELLATAIENIINITVITFFILNSLTIVNGFYALYV